MSAPRKLKGNTASELTRLKKLWLGWSDAQRDAWRSLFGSDTTQAALRQQLSAELGIRLKWDSQLTSFRDWMTEQDLRDKEAEWTELEEQKLQALGLKGEELRAALLEKIKGRAFLTGDHKLGLAAVDRDLKQQQMTLDREKFEFDAAKACLAKLPDLKAVSDQPKLSPDEKAAAIRQILFPH
jgi:hypothetical protein